jgi:predicted phage tail protein
MVIAADVTPPPVPFDLVATPGDAKVQLSWSRVLTADFDHHEVWMRTESTPFVLVTTTTSQDVEITSLQNGTTYWFAVTSVDTSGNASAKSSEVSATPVGIAPRHRQPVLR